MRVGGCNWRVRKRLKLTSKKAAFEDREPRVDEIGRMDEKHI